ncbi:hypothetical protein [Natrinema salaciae]|uniref:Uncharacterized protein n=1 Tax=Natrinema salaciae TaxID=1186196 RepID=A0A1H9ATP3_9EURY|nr:hypothetical protein [Natrinema salaciae]SEP79881.1 hypothetical protein SAMN04489841_0540 [Natrinema salaciae]
MSAFVSRLSVLLVAATAVAVALVGWAGGFLTVEPLSWTNSAVVAGLSVLVLSSLIVLLYEPLEIDDDSN